ncbi:MAG TPA: valine--tRNA ligase [Actinomycetota bacterium]|nr:valine--tRNA ligase [Actinomycetota bacterium]
MTGAPADPTEIPKVYSPAEVENRLYREWETKGYFHAERDPDKEPFTIVIPPPNVTGALHIGHALDHTLQDVLVRFKRMQGYATLWLPGMDHAGIATQNVVERELRSQGLTRHDLGREKFVETVWEWKELYGGKITEQDRRLGSSLDWDRERFTMDEGLTRAVRRVFVDLYNEGLIYRGNRIINWCPRCGTALSDIEVDHSDHEGVLEQFRYDFEDGSGSVSVATTRLETMLGDTAVAVNPKDPRYADAVGKFAIHPFSGRRIEIVADDAVDMEFGTGAVKITPAHDPVDFEIAERHDLEKISIMDGQAKINANGAPFEGMDRYDARMAVRKALQEKGLYEGSTPHNYAIGKCSRCGTIVEPWLSEQWFVSMKPLAAPAIAAVKQERTRFYPARWTNYYLNWMEGIRDWCISRQLWWGHRIPVWYCDNGHQWAAMEDPAGCPECGSTHIHQDPDVLDTWFSSQLWPFSTLGWPDETEDLKYFYPTSVLVTGYEIIHIWVSRMMMSGLRFMDEVPFEWVYIHGIVRDAQGRKMSKSLGNVIDPLELIDQYGTDALRFSLAEHATGQDIFLSTEWVSGSRNFVNKLWNAARFVLANAAGRQVGDLPDDDELELADRWILGRLSAATTEVTRQLEGFETAAAARMVYEFIWSEFCDWYIEAAKQRLYSDDPAVAGPVRAVLVNVLEQALRLAHPFIPFVTEEIWQMLPIEHAKPSIMISDWPVAAPADEDAVNAFARVQDVVSAIRSFRSERGISPKVRLRPSATSDDPADRDALRRDGALISRLAGLDELVVSQSLDGTPGARLIAGIIEIAVPMEGLIDTQAETDRLGKLIEKIQKEIVKIETKLANKGFTDRAPADVVAEQHRRLDEEKATLAKLQAQLALLGS